MNRTLTRRVRTSPHAPEGLLLDDLEQFGLDDERHVADLVEKHGSAIGGFNQTDLRRGGARERAAFIAKEFRPRAGPAATRHN
jgi:hypothetical protein